MVKLALFLGAFVAAVALLFAQRGDEKFEREAGPCPPIEEVKAAAEGVTTVLIKSHDSKSFRWPSALEHGSYGAGDQVSAWSFTFHVATTNILGASTGSRECTLLIRNGVIIEVRSNDSLHRGTMSLAHAASLKGNYEGPGAR